MLTADELRELRRIHVVAGRKADSAFAGDYRSAIRGQGMEFEEVREYSPGDDIRHIDWNVTARTNAPYVKVFREERQITVLLLVDLSGSTRVGSGGRDGNTDRRLQIARVAGGLAFATSRNRDRVGLLTFTDRVETWLPPRRSRGHVWAILQGVYAGRAASRRTRVAEALQYVHKVQKRRAVIVVVSDFLDDGPWNDAMAVLSRRHKVHAVVVHDPLDASMAQFGLLDVVDAETGAAMTIDGSRFVGKVDVDDRLRALRRSGAAAVALSTTEDPFVVLHQHFLREAQRR